jgi:hypothetical protein
VSALVFLVIAVGISCIGSFFLWVRNRKPRTLTSSIDDFRREMQALSPEQASARRAGRVRK